MQYNIKWLMNTKLALKYFALAATFSLNFCCKLCTWSGLVPSAKKWLQNNGRGLLAFWHALRASCKALIFVGSSCFAIFYSSAGLGLSGAAPTG